MGVSYNGYYRTLLPFRSEFDSLCPYVVRKRPDETQDEFNRRVADYMTKRYHRRRNDWIQSQGGACIQCNSDERLEIDHIDPATKLYPIAKILSGGSEAKVQAELAKCQLLCHDCHIDKSIEERSVGHGGGVSGKRNCTCDLCKQARSRYYYSKKQMGL